MKYQQKGFALLYAILLTGAILSVGVILMNIITKQLLFSRLNRESEATYYYLANSGRECLRKAIIESKFVEVGETSTIIRSSEIINCFNKNIDLSLSADGKTLVVKNVGVENAPDKQVDFSVTINTDCLDGLVTCLSSGKNSYSYFAQVDGHSGDSGRGVRRTAIYVEK